MTRSCRTAVRELIFSTCPSYSKLSGVTGGASLGTMKVMRRFMMPEFTLVRGLSWDDVLVLLHRHKELVCDSQLGMRLNTNSNNLHVRTKAEPLHQCMTLDTDLCKRYATQLISRAYAYSSKVLCTSSPSPRHFGGTSSAEEQTPNLEHSLKIRLQSSA